MKMNKKGFTIVELVIVIAVIAILAGVMIPTFGNVIDSANATTAQQEASNVYKQMTVDHASEGSSFTDAEFLIVILKDNAPKYTCTVVNGVVGEATKYTAAPNASTYKQYTEEVAADKTPKYTYDQYSGAQVYVKIVNNNNG